MLHQLFHDSQPLHQNGLYLQVDVVVPGTGTGPRPSDELVATVVAGWQQDVFTPWQNNGFCILSGPVFTVGAGTVQVQINAGAFGTVAQANAAIAALTALDPAASYSITMRVTSANSAAATAVLTVTYP